MLKKKIKPKPKQKNRYNNKRTGPSRLDLHGHFESFFRGRSWMVSVLLFCTVLNPLSPKSDNHLNSPYNISS